MCKRCPQKDAFIAVIAAVSYVSCKVRQGGRPSNELDGYA